MSVSGLCSSEAIAGNRSWTTWFNDTWEWDGAVWTQVADTGPSPRSGSAMAQMGTRTVLFGGYNSAGALADSWEWKDLRWTQRQNMGPPKRTSHDMAYDIERERLVLFGGLDLVHSRNSATLGNSRSISFRRNRLVAQGNAVRRLPPHRRSENRAGSKPCPRYARISASYAHLEGEDVT